MFHWDCYCTSWHNFLKQSWLSHYKIKRTIDLLMLYKTKLDDSFLIARFHMNIKENQSLFEEDKMRSCNTFCGEKYSTNVFIFWRTVNWKLLRRIKLVLKEMLNRFRTTGLILCPLKASENIIFFNVFRGYRKRPVAWDELTRYSYKLINDHLPVLRKNLELWASVKNT